mgnify:CR=1 FL=1
MPKIFKLFILLSFLLILSACGGGGGGGGGGAAGGGASYTVPNCTDAGNSTIRDDEYYGMSNGSNYALARICAGAAYARGATGDGIQVAVIDTGVDADHSDINANMVAFTTGSDVVNSDNNASDDEGHGSHVAGIIAAEKK